MVGRAGKQHLVVESADGLVEVPIEVGRALPDREEVARAVDGNFLQAVADARVSAGVRIDDAGRVEWSDHLWRRPGDAAVNRFDKRELGLASRTLKRRVRRHDQVGEVIQGVGFRIDHDDVADGLLPVPGADDRLHRAPRRAVVAGLGKLGRTGVRGRVDAVVRVVGRAGQSVPNRVRHAFVDRVGGGGVLVGEVLSGRVGHDGLLVRPGLAPIVGGCRGDRVAVRASVKRERRRVGGAVRAEGDPWV